MAKTNSKRNRDQLNKLSNALVALYLTEETGLPCNAKGYELATFEAQDDVGTPVERPALRVTFENDTPIKQPHHLLTFGSDDQRCDVVLEATEASPIHCRVYAQLNSGPNVWVIEDISTTGTEYVDDESLRTRIPKKVAHGRVAAQGLHRIRIGRLLFGFWSPSDNEETSLRERYFQGLEPIPVTQEILREQLRGVAVNFHRVVMVGDGGMGAVFKYIETTTGLMIAVKEEEVRSMEADERVQKEIGYMQSLRHVSQVVIITYHPLIPCSLIWSSISSAILPSTRESRSGLQPCHYTKEVYAIYYLLRLPLSRMSCYNSLKASLICTRNGFCIKTSSPKMSWSKENLGQMLFWLTTGYAPL